MIDWNEIGSRVREARKTAGLSQDELAGRVSLERTALSKIESGRRRVDSLELSRIARVTGRPVDWFLRTRPAAVISRRAARDVPVVSSADLLLEDLAADVELLVDLQVLDLAPPPNRQARRRFRSFADAEKLAREALKAAGAVNGPGADIVGVAEALGLLVFLLRLPGGSFLGSYLSLPEYGVALVDGSLPAGRLRFTIAHEIGHHFLQDEFDVLLDIDTGKNSRERLIDAFAAYFLLPRSLVARRWKELHREGKDDRISALHIGQEYGVSWTALCAHLKNLELISEHRRRVLVSEPPRKAEFMEHGLQLRQELAAPVLPARFSQAVIRAYRKRLLSETRVLEMLRGTISAEVLPVPGKIPLDAMYEELKPIA